ncbi:MAG: response regulator [Ferruginibacter sp.]
MEEGLNISKEAMRLSALKELHILDTASDILLHKKIMVVDDNRINRLVAVTILRNFGATTSEASGGQEAIDALAIRETDLVLMDIQMPSMDGREATGIIREKISRSLPIIALTANANKGDNEKCIDAGMNGYLAKPFKEKDLLNIVAFWLGKTIKVQDVPEPSKAPAPLVFDLSALHQISRGNIGFVEKMVDMFMAQTPVLVKEMEAKFLAGDYVEMGNIAHKIKPVIDNMGIATLKETIREIEKKGKQSIQDESVPALLKTVKTIIGIAVDSLKNDFGANRK